MKITFTRSKRVFLSSVGIRNRIGNKGAVRESKIEGISMVHEVSSNLREENMNKILPTMLDFINQIRCKFG